MCPPWPPEPNKIRPSGNETPYEMKKTFASQGSLCDSKREMARFFPRWTLTRSQLELSRFTFYLMTPITIMYYVGIDTDKKFNLPGYWPDPDTLNKIPKEPHEIQAELARMRQAKIEKRLRLEERAKELGITPESVRAEREAAQKKLLEDEQDEDEQNRAPLPEGEAHKQDQ